MDMGNKGKRSFFSMIKCGLVSITFRNLEPRQIVKLAARTGLDGIEWGGDIHVPHGDVQRARDVYQMTVDAGLSVLSYGSYYRIGEKDADSFEAVLETAGELHTNMIRVWAGRYGSSEACATYREQVVNDSQRIAELACARDMTLAYEYHPGTLTDTDESVVRLLKETAHPCMKTYWQIFDDRNPDASLKVILPWLANVHVFYRRERQHLMLWEGAWLWRRLMSVIHSTGRDHAVLIEFVKDGSLDMFMRDAETLIHLISGAGVVSDK